MTRRTRRSVAGSVLVVLGLVIGAVIATALQAEGRERSKADTNDGGALAAQARRGVRRSRQPGRRRGHCRGQRRRPRLRLRRRPGRRASSSSTTARRGTVTVVDDSVERVANPAGVQVGADTTVHAVDGGALIVDQQLDGGVEARPRAAAVGRRRPTRSSRSSPARAPRCRRRRPTATPCSPTRPPARSCSCDPTGRRTRARQLDLTDAVASITSSTTTRPCWPTPTATCASPRPDHAAAARRRRRRRRRRPPTPLVLQQPGAAVRPRRRGHPRRPHRRRSRWPAARSTEIGQLPGTAPVAPIVYGGCVFAVSTAPANVRPVVPDGDGRRTTRSRRCRSTAPAPSCACASSTAGSGSTTSTPARRG